MYRRIVHCRPCYVLPRPLATAAPATETAALTSTPATLRARLPGLMLRDQLRLGRSLSKAAALRDAGAREQALAQVLAELEAASARVAARKLAVPAVSYPPELPVSQLKDEIAEVIRDNQVVIIAGETGSGKTTQLPKICLELGRGVTGQIGHTQPRRIAARTVAARIAEELDTELGSTVGYQVRFSDNSSDQTLVKLMTDGILLTELQRDRRLLRYDTLIIDEAHERSLNVDFILGYLKRLLPSRPDLKVIITSATIDPQRFSEHFARGESGQHSTGGEDAEGEVPQQDLRRDDRYRPSEPGLVPGEWPVSRRSTTAGREAQRGVPGGRPPGQHSEPGLVPGERPVLSASTTAGREAQRGVPGGRPPGQHSEPGLAPGE